MSNVVKKMLRGRCQTMTFWVAAFLLIISIVAAGCMTTIQTTTTASYIDLSASEFKEKVDSEEVFTLDVHIPEQQHIIGTDAFIPFDDIEANLDMLPEDKSKTIAVYCRSGNMSATAAEELIELGYSTVYNLEGGIYAWEDAGYGFE